MTPPYKLERVVPYGRTDNSGDDTLWGMFISEPGCEAEKVLATWAQTYGVPSELDVEAALARRASHFNENESALDQFRLREAPHPAYHPTRRAIFVLPEAAEAR
jgi:hypothetical protein